MLRAALISLSLVLAFGCKKAEKKETPAPAPAAAPAAAPSADGTRHVAVAVNDKGYTPDKIPGKPGEKLTLTFTRTVDAECISKLKAPDGNMVDLPMNKPVDVAVTVPASGELGFACGMDMFHGTIVAQP